MILKNFVFFDESSTSLTSNPMANESQGKNITLQVSNITATPSFSFTIEGLADLNQSTIFNPISAVRLSDFEVLSTITSAGTYIIPAEGLYKIRLVASSGLGTFKVLGNLTD